ncbi:MAG: FxsA family protein [Microbacterium sp.]|uniref:FxsA family protein n=1 Tax=Microbacterium sp. TaxID=51671 RepID=UPI003D700DA3
MLLLVILFIVVPLVELYVIIQVGQAIGAGPVIALLLLDAVLGAVLLRHQGRAAWRRFNAALNEGRVPHRETFDGVMVIFGGALLLTPGFITDVLGLCLLIPPSRALIRRAVTVVALRRFSMGQRVVFWTAGRAAGRRGPRRGPAPDPGRRSYDVEGTAREVPEEPGPNGPGRPTLPS